MNKVVENRESTVKTKEKDYIVVIDPGHGGEDPGKVGINNAKEKDVNLALSLIHIQMCIRDSNNTQIYDSPFTAIRLLGTSYSNITFNDTTILGAGLSKQISDFSSSGYSGAAIRENANSSAVFNGLTVGAVVSDQTGKNTSTWPFYTDNATPKNLAGNDTVTLLDDDVTYEVPGYPEADTSQGGGVKMCIRDSFSTGTCMGEYIRFIRT